MSPKQPSPMSPAESLKRLQEGNARFVSRAPDQVVKPIGPRPELAGGQHPFAIVLSCSDSRVPSEIVFDCGLGDLFVVRVAGNVIAPSLIGSVEFAAATFGTPLAVVMGHSRCGAVSATLDSLKPGQPRLTENVLDIVQRITPAVAELVPAMGQDDPALLQRAIRANIRASTSQLRHGSQLLERRIAQKQLVVVGAEYALETGRVEFFDLPHQAM